MIAEIANRLREFEKQYGQQPRSISVSPAEYERLRAALVDAGWVQNAVMPLDAVRMFGIEVRVMDGGR